MSDAAATPPLDAMPADAGEATPGNIDRNADGSSVVKLLEPITFKGERISRVTIPALRGRHMMTAPMIDEGITLGELVTWASKVVEPAGIVAELGPADAVDVATELAQMLGKSRRLGARK